ncbi:MAG: dehydrogenase [Planctomycetes bacterium]|nr:dehydrogenase [Planctomycetota bacterium]
MRFLRLATFLFATTIGTLTRAPAAGNDWPQWRGPRRDGTWTESGIVESFSSPKIPWKWSVPVGPGYSGPSVAAGRVVITDRPKDTDPSVERVLCFDAETGKELWNFAYPCEYQKIGYTAGPRANATLDGGFVFALGAMGHMHCLELQSGRVVWQRDLNRDYQIEMPIWGIAAAPLIVDSTVILHIGGSQGACVVGLDRHNGKEKWRSLNDRGQYSSPIVVEQAGENVVVCWTGDSVAGLRAADGSPLWRYEFKPRKMPIGVATPIVDKGRLFVTSFYDGSLLLNLNRNSAAVERAWQRCGASETQTDALQSIISTPLFIDDHIYGVDSYGELRCLDARTGERVWEDLRATPKARWSTIHFVRNADNVWMFNERGELIISRLSPKGFQEISRAQLIAPTREQLNQRNGVCWSHPAFAGRHIFIRNDETMVCASLAK